jgi:Holliday junction resolvasome RuvABC ATP-dependent DNA helicase subunit
MIDIVTRYFPDWKKILNDSVLRHLPWVSGGHVRLFFRLLRTVARNAAITEKTLPIKTARDRIVEAAFNEFIGDWQWLNANDHKWLKVIMTTENPFGNIGDGDLSKVIRLFNQALVFSYQNGESWYGLSPLLRDHLLRHSDA